MGGAVAGIGGDGMASDLCARSLLRLGLRRHTMAGNSFASAVTGTDSQWYKNILATPAIRLAAAGTQYATDAVPVRDAGKVAEILDAFRAKYGAQDVASYYPNPNAAVEITL